MSQDQVISICVSAMEVAMKVARESKAKLWEIRAANSLARFWSTKGKLSAGHHLLAPIYGWFTEGFDTKELQEAKGLLDNLS